jgi:CRP/FNR family transcriptional regulator, cyclic AMP receptor protein
MDTLMTHVVASGASSSRSDATQTTDWSEARNRLVAARGMLGQLPERDLLNLMRRATVRTVRARKNIFRHGDPAATVIAVLEGHVKLSTTTAGGREVVLDIVPPGGCFGELAVFNGWARDADAVAISRARLLFIDGRQFVQVMERSIEGSQAMLRMLSQQLRSARQHVMDVVVLPAPARLAKALITLAELQGPAAARDGMRIELRLSQAELGGMTGLTRESINKNLAALRDAGWISLEGGSVTLLDVAALESLPREHEGRRPGHAKIYDCRSEYFHPPSHPGTPFPVLSAARRVGLGARAGMGQARP